MSMNEADTRYHLIDPVLRDKGYVSRERITLETILTPAPVEPSGAKGRRRKGPGRTDYLLCAQVGEMPKALPVAVLEAKKEGDDPLKGMQQAKGYADCERFDVKYVFATNGHRYGEFDCVTSLQGGPLSKYLNTQIQVLLVGGSRSSDFPTSNLEPQVETRLFSQVVSTARRQIEWLLKIEGGLDVE